MSIRQESVFRRLGDDVIMEHYTTERLTRTEHIRLLESCYNFGPHMFPRMVSIELISTCNLECSICQYSTMQREHMKMERELAKRIILECAQNNVWYVTFAGFGEPTLVPEYVAEMIRFAKQSGIECVSVPTNMTLMNSDIMMLWMEAGLDGLTCSFEGTSPQKYEEIRGHKVSYRKVVDNIRTAFKTRNDYSSGGRKKPYITINCIRTDESKECLKTFIDAFSDTVDRVSVQSLSFHNNRTRASQKYRYTREGSVAQFKIPCRQLGARLNIYSNGEATPCCNDMDAQLSLGNIKYKTIKEVWNSNEFCKLYMASRQLRWHDMPLLCQGCPDCTWAYRESDQNTDDKSYR